MKAAALIGALTVSLFTIFLFSLTLPGANSHHVVFEEIGQMAGALSYIHVVVPVNISGLLNSVRGFPEQNCRLENHVRAQFDLSESIGRIWRYEC